jgi:MarR family transcriptional regulator, organic hydroperoxide resistance regulator
MVATPALASRGSATHDADRLVESVHDVMKTVLHRLAPAVDAEGISMGQFWSLHYISALGAASLSTVARHLAISAPTACASVDSLEAQGLISRQRSRVDRRAVELSLTAKGRKVESRIWVHIGRLMSEAADDLPPEDLATALRVFRELNRRLNRTAPRSGGAA